MFGKNSCVEWQNNCDITDFDDIEFSIFAFVISIILSSDNIKN